MTKMDPILCVDLDGSLCQSDLLVEHSFLVLKKYPWLAFHLIFWALQGAKRYKQKILSLSPQNPQLPWNEKLLEYLKSEKQKGRTLVLATASPTPWAMQVSQSHPGLFDQVFGSDSSVNLKGEKKAALLESHYGSTGFVYAGDSSADWPVFQKATKAIPIGSKSYVQKVKSSFETEVEFVSPTKTLKSWVRAIRIHQWAKNALIFVPMLLAHKFQWAHFQESILGFFSFSLMASSIYLINDILDLESDRNHPKKKLRPFAAGDISPLLGMFAAPLLILLSFSLGSMLNEKFQLVLATYLVVTSLYSFYLKSLLLFDVVTLASLFTLRIFAGSAATDIFISEWLLSFSIFIFFSLALLKRYIEILRLKELGKEDMSGRAYQVDDQFIIAAIGIASGLMAVLVCGIYMSQSSATSLYTSPKRLLGINILIMYWISRIWILAHRGKVHDDPIVFALKDKQSILIGALAAGVLWVASL